MRTIAIVTTTYTTASAATSTLTASASITSTLATVTPTPVSATSASSDSYSSTAHPSLPVATILPAACSFKSTIIATSVITALPTPQPWHQRDKLRRVPHDRRYGIRIA